MSRKEKSSKKKSYDRRDEEPQPKRRHKDQKVKYRHSRAWLAQEDDYDEPQEYSQD